MTTVAIRRADVAGELVDVVWRDGVVIEVAAHRPGVPRERDSAGTGIDEVIDGERGALIPGLHDHHIHLLALAAARASVRLGPPEVTNRAQFAAVLTAACRSEPSGWVRAVGYHDSVAGELDAARLDDLVPAGRGTPIRVQHRSGQLWILNSRAIEAARIADVHLDGVERDEHGAPTGRVFGLDHLLRQRIPPPPLDLAGLAAELAGYGVTGVTDLTPTEDPAEVALLAEVANTPGFPLRVTITGGPGLPADAAAGLPRGPVKFLPLERALPDLDQLTAAFRAAHDAGRAVAVHCVTRAGLVVALAAWHHAGARPGDRIEHGAVIPPELDPAINRLGLTVITQPNLVAERGTEYLRDVDDADLGHLWRCGSLISAGIPVAGGTDAPFGHPDPWRAIAAAVERRTAEGTVVGDRERIEPQAALNLFLGRPDAPTKPRRIHAGSRTDLCLLDRPLTDALAQPTATRVRRTVGRADSAEPST